MNMAVKVETDLPQFSCFFLKCIEQRSETQHSKKDRDTRIDFVPIADDNLRLSHVGISPNFENLVIFTNPDKSSRLRVILIAQH